ncbi:MAG: FMN-binding protein [Desulfamplus sp.]|nr:FMN-binding protein [Desulfamplus sp.]
MKNRIYALKFAAILCVVCSTLITGASVGLKGFQIDNMEVDRQKNILKAAGVIEPGDDREISKAMVRQIYDNSIEEIEENGLTLYLYKGDDGSPPDKTDVIPMESGAIKAYVIPIESKGLWGKIKGYMAFENDGMTVAGFTVYSHSETPGLGGEIEKAWFGKNFVGKKIVDASGGFVSISIAKGETGSLPPGQRENHVDGISGATLTGKYLTQGIRENLKMYEPVSLKFRKNQQQ